MFHFILTFFTDHGACNLISYIFSQSPFPAAVVQPFVSFLACVLIEVKPVLLIGIALPSIGSLLSLVESAGTGF